MSDKLSVNLEALSTSATKVSGLGLGLAVGHTATGSRLSSARASWAGQSAAEALSAWTAKLNTHSASTVNRIDEHSQQMPSAARRYANDEAQRAREMAEVDRAAGGNSVNM